MIEPARFEGHITALPKLAVIAVIFAVDAIDGAGCGEAGYARMIAISSAAKKGDFHTRIMTRSSGYRLGTVQQE
jgi:hypothetical protein